MRRLIFFSIALALVFWGRSILGNTDAPATVALRDGLTIALLGVVLFAAAAQPPGVPRPWPERGPRSSLIRLVILIGFLGAVAGGFWLYLVLQGPNDGLGLVVPLGLWALGVVVTGAGLAWPRPTAPRGAPVWSVEAARRFLRSVTAGRPRRAIDPFRLRKRTVLLGLAFILLVAVLVRWPGFREEGTCSAEECAFALSSLELLRAGSWKAYLFSDGSAYHLLLGLVFGLVGPGLGAVKVVGMLLGLLALPAFFLAARSFTGSGSSLLATFLLALAPWHVTLSLHFVPSSLLLLTIFLFLAVRPRSGAPHHDLRWVLAALLGGLVLYATPKPLTFFVWAWLIFTPPEDRRSWPDYLLLLLAVSLPRLATAVIERTVPGISAGLMLEETPNFLASLVNPPTLLFALTGALALFGLGGLLRFIRWNGTHVLLPGIVLFAAPAFISPASSLIAWAPLLGMMTVVAAIGLDQIVTALATVWAPVVRPTRVLAGSAALLLVMSAGILQDATAAPGVRPEGGELHTAVGKFLYERFQVSVDNGGDDSTLYLVPLDVLRAPATRLAASGVLAFAKHIQPLDPVVHLPFTGPPFLDLEAADLVYVVPADDLPLREVVRQMYPGVVAQPILDDDNRPVAAAYPVSQQMTTALQGLPSLYFPGDEVGSLEEALLTRAEGPLHFMWEGAPPVEGPFTVLGQGALFAPENGVYGFRAELSTGASVELELGDAPVVQTLLDTKSGVKESAVKLPQGFHPLRLVYRSGPQSGDASVQWRRPGGKWEPVPRQALYSAPVDAGVLATYYQGEAESPFDFDGLARQPVLAQRREPLLTASPLLEQADGVIWRAKLAAPIEGTYSFVVDAEGVYQLRVDGVTLLEGGTLEGVPAMGVTSMLLTRDWHDLEIRYRPGAGASFHLTWELPGAELGPIPARFFAPLPPEASLAERPLPAAPEVPSPTGPAVAAPRPGAPVVQPLQSPGSSDLPTGLPELPFVPVWAAGECGVNPEQFLQPRGAAFNVNSGLAYIADAGNRRVIVRNLDDGSMVDFYTDDAFEEPFDLGVNVLGELFVLDATAQTVFRVEEPFGIVTPVTSDTAYYRPRGLGVDLSGALYIADTGGARIVGVGVDGQVLAEYGGRDSPLGQGQPVDVAPLPNGALYAVTAEDGTLWRLDTGEAQRATAPANTFDGPHFAGLLSGAFFLSDPERHMILYYNAEGAPAGQFTADSFVKPVGIAAGRIDNEVALLVVDSAACQASLWRLPDEALP